MNLYESTEDLKFMNEPEVIDRLEIILRTDNSLSHSQADHLDYEGKDLLKGRRFREALIVKARSGKAYELLLNQRYAGFSFDKAGRAAHALKWNRARLLLTSRAFDNYQVIGAREDMAYCLLRMAEDYLYLGEPKEFVQHLLEAETMFDSAGVTSNNRLYDLLCARRDMLKDFFPDSRKAFWKLSLG